MQKYTLFIGIDISKKWIDVCLTLDGNKKQMPHIQLDNTVEGFTKMLNWLEQKLKTAGVKIARRHWIYCMEHTGVYTFRLTKFLRSKDFAYVMVNPLHLKYSLGLRRGKSDKADAADIARYLFLHHHELTLSKFSGDNLLKIKNLLSLRRRLVKSRKGVITAANELQQFTTSTLHAEVVKHSKYQVKHLDKTIKQLEKTMLQLIGKDDELDRLYKLVTSVKGAGLVIGVSMLVYTAGFTAFKTSRQFATYIGLAPFAQRSGTSLSVPAHVSHLAHKKLKGDISCGAMSALRYDQQLKAYFVRRTAEGKNKFVVQNAIRNKFIHRIFAVIKRGTPYVELFQHQK